MSKLFELVRDHIEAFDEVTQEWETAEGKKTLTRSFSRPVTWIERVHQRGVLTALDCLSIIFFALNDWHTLTTEQEIQLAEGWAAELRQAAHAAEIQARDPFTLLPLESIPEGWDWGLAISDADKFLAARGMSWRCAEIAAHIYDQVASEIDEKRFPEALNSKPTPMQKQAEPEAAPVVAETPQERRARWLAMFEEEEARAPRGALQRLADREGVDRSNMRKDINKARAAREEKRRAGGWASQLVQDGKRAR